MKLLEHLNKNNLHHAYLVEGVQEEILPEILSFCESMDIRTSGNPDFCQIKVDSLKIDEALDLRSMSSGKGFSSSRKVFVVCARSLTLDAQNVLLKIFEEPRGDTVFFLVVPDANSLLKTLVSRFYFISAQRSQSLTEDEKKAEEFINMSLKKRIDFIKELLAENKEEDDISQESARSRALGFLSALELSLYKKASGGASSDTRCFEHIFRVRKFLRMPGSSPKMLIESLALVVPDFPN